MPPPTPQKIEECLIKEWDGYLLGIAEKDSQQIWEVQSSLACTMAYLLNFFLYDDVDTDWCGFGADDLLDAEYEFLSPTMMTATGLMYWGDMDENNYLSPFVGEFEREPGKMYCRDFILLFSAEGPDESPFVRPYINDELERQLLLDSRPSSVDNWPHVYRRENLYSQGKKGVVPPE